MYKLSIFTENSIASASLGKKKKKKTFGDLITFFAFRILSTTAWKGMWQQNHGSNVELLAL